jgi:Ca-activated chloride channel family protein
MFHLPDRLYHVAAAGLGLGLALWAANSGASGLGFTGLRAQEQAQFSTGVQLVEVYATVNDQRGGLVTGLGAADFEVYENDQKQTISTFTAGEFPATVVLGVDRSLSMAGEPLRLAKLASQGFLGRLKPDDRSMVVAISNQADVIAPLSTDRGAQNQAIAALDPWSTTALHDSIITTLDRLESEPGRQALVVFSDGTDRYSHSTAPEVVERARRSHALVYAITIGRKRPPLAAELAVVTGGRSFLIKNAKQLVATLQTIAQEIRYQYLLGYTPTKPIAKGTREWRSVRVVVRNQPTGIRVRARDGYTTE